MYKRNYYKRMFKKIILVVGVILLFYPLFATAAEVMPQKIVAVAQSEIDANTIKSEHEVSLYAIKDYSLFDDSLTLKKGEELRLILDDYNAPTRGKRDGYYKVTLKNPLPKDAGFIPSGTMRVATEKDLKGMAQNLGITVVGKILKVPGFSQAVAAAKGIINPDEGSSRFTTARKNVFYSTPLKYAGIGSEFFVEPDGVVIIKLRNEI